MLHNDRGLADQLPELVRLQPWVALQVVQEGRRVRVVVGIGLLYPEELAPDGGFATARGAADAWFAGAVGGGGAEGAVGSILEAKGVQRGTAVAGTAGG